MRFYNQQHRFYCGVDLHARTLYLCILDSAGQVVFDKNLAAEPNAFFQAVGRDAARLPSRRLTGTLCGGEPVSLLGRPSGTDEIVGRGGRLRHSVPSWQKTERPTLKRCLVQLRAETSKLNVADADSANEVNSDPRATGEEEEILQFSRCALWTWRP